MEQTIESVDIELEQLYERDDLSQDVLFAKDAALRAIREALMDEMIENDPIGAMADFVDAHMEMK